MKTSYKRIPFDLELAKKIMNKEAKGIEKHTSWRSFRLTG